MFNMRSYDTRVSNKTGAHRHLRRPSVNITPAERLGRVAIGLFAIIAGGLLLFGAGSLLVVVLEVLLILTGADLVVTGALGHCPLYRKLGYVPPPLRRWS
jgi:hypothetical protein